MEELQNTAAGLLVNLEDTQDGGAFTKQRRRDSDGCCQKTWNQPIEFDLGSDYDR